MENVYVIGIGMTPFGRMLGVDIKTMTRSAVRAALDDAQIEASALDAAFFANAAQGHMEGQHMVRGEIALRAMGLQQIPIINIENACASGSTAFATAVMYLKAAEGEVALVVGAEKLFSEDRSLMLSSFNGGWDVSTEPANRRRLLMLGEGVDAPAGTTSDKSYSVFMDVYAAFARAHMKRFGTTQHQFAAVAAKNHRHSVHNGLSQFREEYSVEEVLAAPPITYPLTLPMCAPISDGAAAVILMSGNALRKHGLDNRRAIRVLACAIQTGSDRDASEIEKHCSARTARIAYEKAGLGPEDVSVAEVHDATVVGEIIQIENLGFCDFGEGGAFTERGETTIGGRIPVNPSGGLISKGHPVGATGIGQIHELVTQLRAEGGPRQVEGAKIALAENGGGLHGIEEAVTCVTILGR